MELEPSWEKWQQMALVVVDLEKTWLKLEARRVDVRSGNPNWNLVDLEPSWKKWQQMALVVVDLEKIWTQVGGKESGFEEWKPKLEPKKPGQWTWKNSGSKNGTKMAALETWTQVMEAKMDKVEPRWPPWTSSGLGT